MRVTLTVDSGHRRLDVPPDRTLAEALAEDRGATGTATGTGRVCTDGTCGACTVLLDGEAVRSCLLLAVQCDGADVRTAGGLAAGDPLRAVLAAHAAHAGCDCAAGLVVLAAGALERDPDVARDPRRLRRLLDGNVCGCTGHEALEDAVVRAAAREAGACRAG